MCIRFLAEVRNLSLYMQIFRGDDDVPQMSPLKTNFQAHSDLKVEVLMMIRDNS